MSSTVDRWANEARVRSPWTDSIHERIPWSGRRGPISSPRRTNSLRVNAWGQHGGSNRTASWTCRRPMPMIRSELFSIDAVSTRLRWPDRSIPNGRHHLEHLLGHGGSPGRIYLLTRPRPDRRGRGSVGSQGQLPSVTGRCWRYRRRGSERGHSNRRSERPQGPVPVGPRGSKRGYAPPGYDFPTSAGPPRPGSPAPTPNIWCPGLPGFESTRSPPPSNPQGARCSVPRRHREASHSSSGCG